MMILDSGVLFSGHPVYMHIQINTFKAKCTQSNRVFLNLMTY